MRRSWKLAALAAVGVCAASLPGRAAVLYTNDFGNISNGNLVTDQSTGQGGFVQTGTVATNPIQVTNGVIALGPTGQDVSASFVPVTSGSSVYTSAVATITAAGTGDYFLHLAN